MTLVEVILAITILSLICTISFTKLNLDNYRTKSFVKQLASDIRYVRKINKLGNTNVYIFFNEKEGKKGYVLRENGNNVKNIFLPKGVEIKYSESKILFDRQGAFHTGGTTISVGQNGDFIKITIVPVSGRVLIKEGIYDET